MLVGEEKAPADVAERLGVRKGQKVLVRRRRYLLEGFPVEYAVSFVPTDISRGTAIELPDTGPGGIYARIEEQGHRLGSFREEVTARMPTREESDRLALTAGVPVLHLVRTAEDKAGRVVEVCDTVMAAHSFVLDYKLPAN